MKRNKRNKGKKYVEFLEIWLEVEDECFNVHQWQKYEPGNGINLNGRKWEQTWKKNEQNPRKNSNNKLNEPEPYNDLAPKDLDPSIIQQSRTRSITKIDTTSNKYEMSRRSSKKNWNKRNSLNVIFTQIL